MDEIRKLVAEHTVPQIYSDVLTYRIQEEGLEQFQYILDNHKQGGVKLEAEEQLKQQFQGRL